MKNIVSNLVFVDVFKIYKIRSNEDVISMYFLLFWDLNVIFIKNIVLLLYIKLVRFGCILYGENWSKLILLIMFLFKLFIKVVKLFKGVIIEIIIKVIFIEFKIIIWGRFWIIIEIVVIMLKKSSVKFIL